MRLDSELLMSNQDELTSCLGKTFFFQLRN